MSSVSDELQHALEELLMDLFQSPRPADAALVLRALASLAASSPSAQKRLGQTLLADASMSTSQNTSRVTRLQLLAERFLYDAASAVETLALFAVLAHRNVANQRRIARHVKGVSVSIPQTPSTNDLPLTLLVLSLPNALQAEYKAWNSRQRELLVHRVPSGSPPALDGVPAACFCDECLGAPQLLATWVSHFEDLSRWSSRNDPSMEAASVPRLGSEEFLQRVLVGDYSLRQCRWTLRDGDTDAITGVDNDDPGIYFFTGEAEERLSTIPDPRRHACAILVDPTVAGIVRNNAKAAEELTQQCGNVDLHRAAQDDDDNEDSSEDLEHVLLLERRVELSCCESPIEKQSGLGTTSWLPTIGHFLSTTPQSERTITPDSLRSELDQSVDVTEWERRIFISIVSFLESETQLDIQELQQMLQLVSAPSPDEDTLPVRIEVSEVRVVTTYTGQTIEITARTLDGDEFAAQLSIDDLTESISPNNDVVSLLSVSEESLLGVLQYCRLCNSDDPGGCSFVGGLFHLKRREPTRVSIEGTDNHLDHVAIKNESCPKIDRSVVDRQGLSTVAERHLQALSLVLASGHEGSVLDVANRIRRIVRDCNERMGKLANSADRTDSQRQASRERCRVCRDLLIQAAKRMKLGTSAEATATLATVAKTRLQRSISRVLQLSEGEDAWETPDERVQRLHLSKQVWASGVPDPEFYVDSQARAKTNSTAQRRLNYLLVKQIRQQRSMQS